MSEAATRPRTRAECEASPRPCPFVGCRHHLLLDVTHVGSLMSPGLRVLRERASAEKVSAWADAVVERIEASRATCALDVAQAGEATLQEVGDLLGISRERVNQIEDEATLHFAARQRFWSLP